MATFDLKAIVETLNAAALDPTRWGSALEALVSQTNSFGSIVFPLQGPMPYIPATRSMEESFEVYVRDGWINRDERFRAKNQLLRRGVATDRDVMPEEELKRNPYYQEFLARCNLKDVAAVRVGTGEHVWSLTVHRTFQQESFSAAEVDTLRQLSVQLSSTAEVATAFGVAQGAAALSTFDVAGKAAVLLNRQGDVVRANALAEELFDVHVSITRGRLTSTDKNARDSYETALKRLLWSLDASGAPPISFPRPGRSSIIVYLMRSFQLAETPLSAYHAIAVLIDPDARLTPAMQTLQTHFELTPAEARLAIALQAGNDLQSAAVRLNVSLETVRKQVKSIFGKTGLRRQTDLIAMLSNLLPNS